MTPAQRKMLLELRSRLAERGGEIIEIREEADFVGATLRGSGIRRDGGEVELFVLPSGEADVGQLAVPSGTPVSWQSIEAAARHDERRAATDA
jgi:hypothetical protein